MSFPLSKFPGQISYFVRRLSSNPASAFRNRSKAGGIWQVSGALRYDETGTVREVVNLDGVQTLSNKSIGGAIYSDAKVLTAQLDLTNNTLASITGWSWSLTAAGVYVFEIDLPCIMTTNGGLTLAFKYTTATLTSLNVETYQSTATDNATAVSTNFTTTTDQAKFVDNKTAAYTITKVRGAMVVNAAGSVALQAAQNTTAGGADTTSLRIGSRMLLYRAA